MSIEIGIVLGLLAAAGGVFLYFKFKTRIDTDVATVSKDIKTL